VPMPFTVGEGPCCIIRGKVVFCVFFTDFVDLLPGSGFCC
jgi:hypothetical protein